MYSRRYFTNKYGNVINIFLRPNILIARGGRIFARKDDSAILDQKICVRVKYDQKVNLYYTDNAKKNHKNIKKK